VSYWLPEWPAPANVKSVITACEGGVSEGAYASNNMGLHVGDKLEHVQRNRASLQDSLGLNKPTQWLEQVHGTKVVPAQSDGLVRTADGSYTQESGLACSVMTADCLPVLLCDREGTQVAAIHAGWRGLAGNILRSARNSFNCSSSNLLVYLGPAISQAHFEVGVDVLEAFFENAECATETEAVAACFKPSLNPMRFYADIYALARIQFTRMGVESIYGGGACTFGDIAGDKPQYYSYRRQADTGRMASLIWLG